MILQFLDYIRWKDIIIAEYEIRRPDYSIQTLEMLAITKLREFSQEAKTIPELQKAVKDWITDA